ncbi:MAG: hypothetical protein QOH05_342 [Acetobacteraceae bacterium]|nr:hypothetical protein [Acetobacteraceae bacterium]
MVKENYIEVHVPISPIPFFFNRVRYLAKSLRGLGGDFAHSKIIVTIGDASPPTDLDRLLPWAREEGVEWRWLDRHLFGAWYKSNNPYVATMMDRFRMGFASEYVIIADADILFCRDLSDLIETVSGRLDVGGVMTHVAPFVGVAGGSHAEWWGRMFTAFGLPPPELAFEHTGWGHMFDDPSCRFSPVYFNSGMVIGTGEALNLMAPLAYPALVAVRSVLDTFYFDQIAFTLMMYKAGVTMKLIPARFNFPNQASFESTFPEEAADVAVLHYLRTDVVERDRVFNSPGEIEAFIGRPDLTGSNELLRSRVAAIHGMLT